MTRPAGRPLRQPFQILPAETHEQPIGKLIRCIFDIFMQRKVGPLLIPLKSRCKAIFSSKASRELAIISYCPSEPPAELEPNRALD